MKFGVVLCPRCKTAKGIRLNTKTSRCAKCGKNIDLKKAQVLCRVNSERQLSKVVMEYNKSIMGGNEIYLEDIKSKKQEKKKATGEKESENSSLVYEEVLSKLNVVSGRDEKIVCAAKELCNLKEEFTEDDFIEILRGIGIDKEEDCRRYLAKLMANDMIYEPKSGIYRCL